MSQKQEHQFVLLLFCDNVTVIFPFFLFNVGKKNCRHIVIVLTDIAPFFPFQ